MEIEVEFQSGIPLYEQIVYQLRILIAEGKVSPEDQLPTTRQLAVKLGINFNTVARAYRLLSQEGLISTQPGRGTYVLDTKKRNDKENSEISQVEKLTRFYIRKAAHLGFGREEIKDCFERLLSEEEE